MRGILGWVTAVLTLGVGVFVGMWMTKRFGRGG